MIYLIYFFGIVIIGTLVFIYFVLKWFIEEKLKTYRAPFTPQLIIEKAYRARDFFYSLNYTRIDDVRRHQHLLMPNTTVIKDDDHKNWLIKQSSIKLVEDMFKAGCVEVREEDELFSIQKRIDIRIKVYQPEA